jgi:hypothetical protein
MADDHDAEAPVVVRLADRYFGRGVADAGAADVLDALACARSRFASHDTSTSLRGQRLRLPIWENGGPLQSLVQR